jgi:hypothetical protein
MPSCSSGLGFFLFFSFCLVASTASFCKKFILYCHVFPLPYDIPVPWPGRECQSENDIHDFTVPVRITSKNFSESGNCYVRNCDNPKQKPYF